MFVALEGIDGSGKSTVARLLYESLKGKGFVLTREPTESRIGIFIKELLKEQELSQDTIQLLFTADRAYHMETFVEPMLKEGHGVITDRYLFSTIAYGYGAGLEVEWIEKLNSRFRIPDLTFLMDLDPETAVQRIGKRNEKGEFFEKLDFLKRVREGYLMLSKRYDGFVIIDASMDERSIRDSILSVIEDKI